MQQLRHLEIQRRHDLIEHLDDADLRPAWRRFSAIPNPMKPRETAARF
jgi:hypothetical protein